jgi:mRNA-degrading endonuclease toxin of MazEF toxin-antitoxin module
MSIKRGDIFYVFGEKECNGHVESRFRPVVVVTSPMGCNRSPVQMVCPITTHQKDLRCNVDITYRRPSQVLCNQIFTVSNDDLVSPKYREKIRLTGEEMKQVDEAIMWSLGLQFGGEFVD